MIVCPNCFHKEMVGAFFCSECGAQMVFPDGIPTSSIHPISGSFHNSQSEDINPQMSSVSHDSGGDGIIALEILGIGVILPIHGRREITIGRRSEGQPIIPDIDLTPYKALESGVSRLHVSIQFTEKEITLTDLGSVNGTWLNGKRVSAHTPYPINLGDLMRLGKLEILVLDRNKKKQD